MNIFGLLCCIIAGAEESVNAILFAESTISLSLPQGRFQEILPRVGFWSLMYLMLAIIQVLTFSGQGISFAISSERMIQRVKLSTFRTVLHQDTEFFEKGEARSGTIMSMISKDTADMGALSGATLGILLIVLTTLISAFIIAMSFGWRVALVCTATIPILLSCSFMAWKVLGTFAEETSQAVILVANQAVEAISQIREIAILGREGMVLEEFHRSLSEMWRKSLRTSVYVSLLYALALNLQYSCMVLGFWYGGGLIAKGE